MTFRAKKVSSFHVLREMETGNFFKKHSYMASHRYILEPYQSGKPTRFDCPQCSPEHRKTFSRYLDRETGEYLADHVGRCSRESNCAYHYTPRQHYQATKSEVFNHGKYRPTVKKGRPALVEMSTIPVEILKASRKGYEHNSFIDYLLTFTDSDMVSRLISRYHIGTSKRWDGATVFWWITPDGSVTGGQVVLFGKDGHTVKYTDSNSEQQRCIRPIHKVLLRQYKEKKLTSPDWLITYDQHGEKFPTLFGLHQLKTEPTTKPIAIAEAPATAIVASVYFPQFIWLAAGSLSWLNEKRLAPLKGRTVCLFPDLNGFEKWQKKAIELRHLANFTVSDFLERRATDEQRKQGLDLRDFLINFSPRAFQEPRSTIQSNLGAQPVNKALSPTKQAKVFHLKIVSEVPFDYPPEWDVPSEPNAIPKIRVKSLHEWQQQYSHLANQI